MTLINNNILIQNKNKCFLFANYVTIDDDDYLL